MKAKKNTFLFSVIISALCVVFVSSCASGTKTSGTTRTVVTHYGKAPPKYQVVQVPQTTHKIESVGEGMTKDQIRAVMGQPDGISDMCCGKDKPKIWSYHGIKCFERESRPEAQSRFSGNCEVHFDKKTNRVVGWDKRTSRVIVRQRQCIANCN